jgi:FkbM family methyltransferase
MKSMIRKFLKTRGQNIIPNEGVQSLLWSVHLEKLFKHNKIDCVVDVGGNYGQFASEVRRLPYTGRIISFEPVCKFFHALQEISNYDDNWEISSYALGAEAADAEINVMESPGLSSILQPDTVKMKEHLPAPDKVGLNHVQPIVIRRLDELASEIVFLAEALSVFLKIDTQGFDLKVMEGAEFYLDNVNIIQLEISMISIYDMAPLYDEALSYMRKLGYQPSAFFPVTFNNDLAAIEFDCVFVRSKI